MLTTWPLRLRIRRRSVDEADQWLNDDPGPKPQQKPPKQEADNEEATSKQVGFSAQQEGRKEKAEQKTTVIQSRGLPKKSQSMKEVLLTNSSSRPAVSFSRSSSMPDHPDLDNLDLGEFNVEDVDDSDDDYSDDDTFDKASDTKKEKGPGDYD